MQAARQPIDRAVRRSEPGTVMLLRNHAVQGMPHSVRQLGKNGADGDRLDSQNSPFARLGTAVDFCR